MTCHGISAAFQHCDEHRFWPKVVVTESCWLWTASTTPAGYGTFRTSERGTTTAHRAAYQMFVGPIPEGMVLDHLCRNRACVNPEHLEPVTSRENVLRGIGPHRTRRRYEQRTHCGAGHPLTGDNLILRTDGGRYRCRTCFNAWRRAQRRKAKNS